MGEVSRVKINRRGPVDGIQVLGCGLIGSGMLSVTRKGGNAWGLTRGTGCAAAICAKQNNQRQKADNRTKRDFSK